MLQECIEDSSRRGAEICIAWLDLANAFGSVPHISLITTLRQAGLTEEECGLISNLYKGSSTQVNHPGGLTEPIHFRAGVRQGCPLSPVIFNIVMENIRTAKTQATGFNLRGSKINVLCYADDGVLVAPDPKSLQHMLNNVVRAATWFGLKFKPPKCASLHIRQKRVGESGAHWSVFFFQLPTPHVMT